MRRRLRDREAIPSGRRGRPTTCPRSPTRGGCIKTGVKMAASSLRHQPVPLDTRIRYQVSRARLLALCFSGYGHCASALCECPESVWDKGGLLRRESERMDGASGLKLRVRVWPNRKVSCFSSGEHIVRTFTR